MATGKQEYTKMAEKASPPSPKVKDTVKAFLFGGAICTLGQGLYALYTGCVAGFSEGGLCLINRLQG